MAIKHCSSKKIELISHSNTFEKLHLLNNKTASANNVHIK